MMRRWCVGAALVSLAACGEPGAETDDTDTPKESDTPEETDVDTETPPVDDTDGADTDPMVDTDPPVPPGDPCRVSPAQVLAGTGESGYAPLTPAQDLKMVFGPQGGWHLWGGLLAQNVSSLAVLDFSITDVATSIEVHRSRINIGLQPLVGSTWACEGTYAGLLGVLGTTELTGDPMVNPPQALCGREVELRYELHHPTGDAMGSGSVRVVAQPDDAHGPRCASPTLWPIDGTM